MYRKIEQIRVMKTAERLGIRTVAVYSDADRTSMHVEHADEAHYIGPSPATQSYLVIDNIIEACKATGADAVHPGYGFLSENNEFVKRLDEEVSKYTVLLSGFITRLFKSQKLCLLIAKDCICIPLVISWVVNICLRRQNCAYLMTIYGGLFELFTGNYFYRTRGACYDCDGR